MKKEFNLSKKAIRDLSNNPIPNYYWEQDVKEFIKEIRTFLEERTTIVRQPENIKLITFQPFEFEDFLKKRAGNSLSDNQQLNQEESKHGRIKK